VEVVGASGEDTFAIVAVNPDQTFGGFPGFEEVGREQVPYVGGQHLTLTTFRATG
jgi:hypothetical protein